LTKKLATGRLFVFKYWFLNRGHCETLCYQAIRVQRAIFWQGVVAVCTLSGV